MFGCTGPVKGCARRWSRIWGRINAEQINSSFGEAVRKVALDRLRDEPSRMEAPCMNLLPPDWTSNGLTCRTVAQQSSAYLDETLPAHMKLRMASHLSTCSNCRLYVRQITLVRDAVVR